MFKEDLLLGYLRLNNFVKPYICVAGGVFANVRLNLRLRQHFQDATQAKGAGTSGDAANKTIS